MDLAELKNIDAKELISKLKNSEIFKDKKTLTKIGIFAFAFFISLIVYYSFVSPIIKQQKTDIIKMQENMAQIDNLNFQIEDILSQTQELEPEYFKNSVLFHSKEEVEDLYQSISNFALANGLTIVNIKKGEPKGVKGDLPDFSMDNTGMVDMGAGLEGEVITDGVIELPDADMGDLGNGDGEGGNILYYQIPVDYEITGTFIGYLKFRRALSKSLKVINFDSEEINLLKQPQGQVLAKGTISIVGLANEYK
jgi:Tfp pilus assembly protein PilO